MKTEAARPFQTCAILLDIVNPRMMEVCEVIYSVSSVFGTVPESQFSQCSVSVGYSEDYSCTTSGPHGVYVYPLGKLLNNLVSRKSGTIVVSSQPKPSCKIL